MDIVLHAITRGPRRERHFILPARQEVAGVSGVNVAASCIIRVEEHVLFTQCDLRVHVIRALLVAAVRAERLGLDITGFKIIFHDTDQVRVVGAFRSVGVADPP